MVPALATGLAAQCAYQAVPGGVFGPDGEVCAMAWWDSDGPGPATPRVVVGGRFTRIGSLATNGVAAYDPATGSWSSFGTGVGSGVYSFAVTALAAMPNGDLIVGGLFASAGGVPALNIARWNGVAWAALGSGVEDTNNSGPTRVRTLAVLPNGDVVAGGDLTIAGGAACNGIARWNGTSWSSLGSGVTYFNSPARVNALAVRPNGELLVGGDFLVAGGLAAQGFAAWNGVWQSLPIPPVGLGFYLKCMTLDASGWPVAVWSNFNNSTAIYRFNGASWSWRANIGPLGVGMPAAQCVQVLANGELVVGGNFGSVGGFATPHVARSSGAAWLPCGGGLSGYANAVLQLPNGALMVGGYFQSTLPSGPSHLALWQGSSWASTQRNVVGGSGWVLASVAEPSGAVVVGGRFDSVGAVPAPGLARWTGTAWQPFGSGLAWSSPSALAEVRAVARHTDGSLVVGGSFNTAGGVSALNIARWNGVSWSALGSGRTDVDAVAVMPNGFAVAACNYPSDLSLWNGTSWTYLGGFPVAMTSLAVLPNGSLAVGLAGGGIQVWNTQWWSPIGGGFSATAQVSCLSIAANGDLLVGGTFPAPPGTTSANVARWNGATWSGFGSGYGAAVSSIAELADGSVAIAAQGMALRWRGSTWSTLATFPSTPKTLAGVADGTLWVGGAFTTANGAPSYGLMTAATDCPARVLAAGAGCSGPGGALVLTAPVRAWVGGTARSECTGLGVGGLGLAVYGVSPWSVPLNSILPVGGAGCQLWTATDLLVGAIAPSGTAAMQLSIPASSALVGVSIYHQFVQVTLDAAGVNGLYASNALDLRIGTM